MDDVSVADLSTQTLTLSGSPESGVITATVPGEFSLVFDANYAWQPRSWYDLTTDPAQDLANEGRGSRTKNVLWSPGIASVMGQWLSIEGAYTVAAVNGQAAFYPTDAYLRHAPAFVIENWPAEAFVIRKGEVEIATGAAPNRPWANTFYDAARQRLVFQYLPDIEPDELIEQRTFEVTVGRCTVPTP